MSKSGDIRMRKIFPQNFALRENLLYDGIGYGFLSGKQHNRVSSYSTPQKYGQMEPFLTAEWC
jgi:hypothetical protein